MPDERMAERMPDRMSEYTSERLPGRMSEYMSDKLPEYDQNICPNIQLEIS